MVMQPGDLVCVARCHGIVCDDGNVFHILDQLGDFRRESEHGGAGWVLRREKFCQ